MAASLFLFLLLPSTAVLAQMEDQSYVRLQSLDKITARTETFEARVGSTVKFGPLFIKVNSCQKSSPLDKPESAAFLQIWEIDENREAQWIFSGWMFASSPALSPMDHAIYDVWVLDCYSDAPAAAAQNDGTEDEQAESTSSPDSAQEEGVYDDFGAADDESIVIPAAE
ncbi:MAG: DUF2155 domain-containing protein [Alphaproteobacteria bacterium]